MKSIYAASFDCKKASSDTEKAICSDSELSNLDSQLAEVYRAIMNNPHIKTEVKLSQREWLKRIKSCKELTCLKNTYRDRIKELSLREKQKEPDTVCTCCNSDVITENIINNLCYHDSGLDFQVKYQDGDAHYSQDGSDVPLMFSEIRQIIISKDKQEAFYITAESGGMGARTYVLNYIFIKNNKIYIADGALLGRGLTISKLSITNGAIRVEGKHHADDQCLADKPRIPFSILFKLKDNKIIPPN